MKLVESECPNCGAEFWIDESHPENVTNIYYTPQKNSSLGVVLILGLVVFLGVVLVGAFLSDDNDMVVLEAVQEIKEEVYLQGNKLTDVAFVENLPNLKKLDITDNYVTDLRPLGNQQQLETVWCGENSISQGKDLGEDVTVILDSKAKEGALWR